MKILLCSGPPSSGKDTFCKYLYNRYNHDYNIEDMNFERFSYPIKSAFAAATDTTFNHFVENEEYEHKKEEVIPLFGVSYRQWQIDFSEKFMKPLYSNNIFSRLFNNRMERYKKEQPDGVVLVPDLGFDIEIQGLEEQSYISHKDILIVRTHRKGFDFSKDSRKYVNSNKITCIDVNNVNIKDFEQKADKIFTEFMGNRNVQSFSETVI